MRDSARIDSPPSNEFNTCTDPGGYKFNLKARPHKKWKEALSDRTFKERLTVSVGAESTIQAAKQLALTKCRADVIISGFRLGSTPAAMCCTDPQDLDFAIRDNPGAPSAVFF